MAETLSIVQMTQKVLPESDFVRLQINFKQTRGARNMIKFSTTWRLKHLLNPYCLFAAAVAFNLAAVEINRVAARKSEKIAAKLGCELADVFHSSDPAKNSLLKTRGRPCGSVSIDP